MPVGDMFGPYELRSRIGIGGMGEVYQAYDTAKDRIVALKLLRPEFAADPNFQERFRRESRMAARLHEPHIIPVHDFGEIDRVLYIDMRYVQGADLRSTVAATGPMPPARATAIIGQVAAALDAAHATGLTHRDVKPENVLLTDTDFAYLVDFGIARSGGDSGLTSAGSAIGSCAYMSPERFTGGHVGPPADVYSLACLLYECLTARPPFPTGDLTRLMSAHIMSPPPRPSDTVPGLNVAFDGVIAWGMAKDPAARCPSAGELARAASAAAFQPPSRRTGFAHGKLIGAAGLGVALLAAGAAAAWLAFGPDDQSVDATESSTGTLTRPATTVPTVPTATSVTSATSPRQVTLPGTDALGFLAYPGARCDSGDSPAALGLTGNSALVVCRSVSGDLYYRGVRLSDGAGIELGGATAASNGFDVVNPADGTRYRIRPTALTIVTPDNQAFTEPMTEYSSSPVR